jgi:hypothetical protein
MDEQTVTFAVTKEPRGLVVSSVAVIEETRGIVRDLERREMQRGHKLPDARRRIASRVGAVPGTLINLARGRLKKFDAGLRERIRAALIREIEQEIGRLSHELETLTRAGSHPASAEVCEAQRHLAAAKRLIGI